MKVPIIPIFVNWKLLVLVCNWIVVFIQIECSNEPKQQWTDKSSRTIMRWFTWYFPSAFSTQALIIGASNVTICEDLGGGLQILNELREKIVIENKIFSLSLTELKSGIFFFKLLGVDICFYSYITILK